MKGKKRFAALLLSFLMVFLLLPVSALAADPPTGSLTIQNEAGATKESSSYDAYRIISFNASIPAGGTEYVYTDLQLDPAYKAAIVSSIGLSGSPTDAQIFDAVKGLSADQTAALAVALKGVVDTTSPTTGKYSADHGVFSALPYGYYLVLETANNANDGSVISKPILVGVPNTIANGGTAVKVKVKTSKAGIEKKIVETDPNDATKTILVDSSTAAIGDTINYQSTSTFPTYSADAQNITYYATDTFSKGLDFEQIDSVEVVNAAGDTTVATLTTDTADGTYYKLTTNTSGAEDTFTLELLGNGKDANIKTWGNAGDKLVIKYHATLNSDANVGSTGNPNSINLTYSNKPGVDTYSTPDDTVITYTIKLVITKADSADPNKKLAGAVFDLFRLKKGENPTLDASWEKIETQTTADGTGIATFTKLQQGTYKLVETAAPAGYNLLTAPIQFTVGAKNDDIAIPDESISLTYSGNTAALAFKATWTKGPDDPIIVNENGLTLDIADTAGFTLPGTGGIGTTIFFVSGFAILALGGCLAFVYMKKNRKTSQHSRH